MTWRTNTLVLKARDIGRILGLNKWLASYVNDSEYEARYDNSFSRALRTGDYVWDVGANVGYYTKLFSERVGHHGKVFAFEPSPANFARLTSACTDLDNVKLLPVGLGRVDDKLSFQQGDDELGATSRIIENEQDGIEVNIRSGQSMLRANDVELPNVIKIDVEGFELEVLEGLGEFLMDPTLRVIGVEVHFGILKERGVPDTPKRIESLLQQKGFKVSWPDISHILASR